MQNNFHNRSKHCIVQVNALPELNEAYGIYLLPPFHYRSKANNSSGETRQGIKASNVQEPSSAQPDHREATRENQSPY